MLRSMIQTYIVTYAAGFGRGKSFIDSTARKRCDKALEVARRYENVIFVLGAGISAVGLRRHHASLADEMAKYFESKGWPRERIITNPLGYDTVSETAAAIEAIELSSKEPAAIIAVTSWYHVPRVFAIWRWGFGKKVAVVACSSQSSFLGVCKEPFALLIQLIIARHLRTRV